MSNGIKQMKNKTGNLKVEQECRNKIFHGKIIPAFLLGYCIAFPLYSSPILFTGGLL